MQNKRICRYKYNAADVFELCSCNLLPVVIVPCWILCSGCSILVNWFNQSTYKNNSSQVVSNIHNSNYVVYEKNRCLSSTYSFQYFANGIKQIWSCQLSLGNIGNKNCSMAVDSRRLCFIWWGLSNFIGRSWRAVRPLRSGFRNWMTNFRLSNLYATIDIYETNFLDLKLTQGIIKKINSQIFN